MECIKPLHLGENGYNETDIRVRGLAFLEINYERLHRLQLHDLEVLTPIYVVRREHFLNKSISKIPRGAEIYFWDNESDWSNQSYSDYTRRVHCK